jgi:hypothetical protein
MGEEVLDGGVWNGDCCYGLCGKFERGKGYVRLIGSSVIFERGVLLDDT